MEMISVTTKVRDLDVILSLHTARDPPAESWSLYMDLIKTVKDQNGGNTSTMRNLVVSDGGGPNAKQRQDLRAIFDGRPNKITVITNSLSNPLKRGLVTAISWLNPDFKAVSVEQWEEGLKHIDLQGEIARLLVELERMQSELGRLASLELLAKLARRE